MAFSDDELERYARHVVLHDVGGPGQARFKAARVLVVGAGGLGAPVLQYLAAAGIGTIGIVDDDVVSLSNLQRQVIHRTEDIDRPKVISANEALTRINPHVEIVTHEKRLVASNAIDLIGAYDLVVDGSDNFATRYLVSDAAHLAARPLVTGAVGAFDGNLTTIRSFDRNERGDFNPTYRCLFPRAPRAEDAPTCETIGILGALTGVIGSMMALEVLKEVAGIGQSLVGRLIVYDGKDTRFREVHYSRDPANPLNGDGATITSLSGH